MVVFVIEHLEPRVWKWCGIEYKHISELVGKNNVWFTNIKKSHAGLSLLGSVYKQSVRDLTIKRVCVLDPEAQKILTPEDAQNFDYFIFGGILGDDPPKKRTQEELTPFLPHAQARNIGKEQMSTDNAVFVVREILGGKKLEDIQFQDGFELEIREGEAIHLPYRYALVDRKPLVSKELISYLKKKKDF